MQFSVSVLTEIFHQLYNFMLDTKFFGISLFYFWFGMMMVGISVTLLGIVIQHKHGG